MRTAVLGRRGRGLFTAQSLRLRQPCDVPCAALFTSSDVPLRYAFIVNPAARMGRAGRRVEALQAAIGAAGLDATLHQTERPRHAVALARQLAAEADVVVAVGGDGTVHEVAEGLVAAGGTTPLGVVPVGTGNDFVKMLSLPRGLAAVAGIAHARVVHADYGVVRWHEGGAGREGFFCNGLGVGFDAQVAAAAPRYKALPGVAGYLLAVLETLGRWQGPVAQIRVDDGTARALPLLLAAIGNGTTAGGGFRLTPEADIADGTLDLCLIRDVPRRRILTLLPTALRGTHVAAPEVSMARFTRLQLTTATPVAIHADGEVLTRATRHVEVHVVPGGLSVLVGGHLTGSPSFPRP